MENTERVEISWYSNDQMQDKKYYLGDEYHRDNNQPAFQSWFKNGNKMLEIYLVNGQTHRTNGPAFIEWFENGKPRNIDIEYMMKFTEKMVQQYKNFQKMNC